MDFTSFLVGVFLINNLSMWYLLLENRRTMNELCKGIDRLIVFLNSREKRE